MRRIGLLAAVLFLLSATLVSVQTTAPNLTQITMFDRHGKLLGNVGEPLPRGALALAPDASRVAFIRMGALWTIDVASGAITSVATDAVNPPAWSPDGKRLAYNSNQSAGQGTYVRAANGTGPAELLIAGNISLFHWSPDGRYLAVIAASNLALLPVNGDHKPISFVPAAGKTGMRVSPDGQFIAYASNESGARELYVRPFDPSSADPLGAAAPVKITTEGVSGVVRWRSDGKELYYMTADERVMVVAITSTPRLKAEPPALLFRAPERFKGTTNPGRFVDVSADGERFVFLLPVPASAPAPR